jgi:hypothetical protein
VLFAHHPPGPARPCPGVRSIKCTSHRQITVARRQKSRARSQRDLAALKSLPVLAADSLTVGNYGITIPSFASASCKLQTANCHCVQAPNHTKPMLRDRKPQQEGGINCRCTTADVLPVGITRVRPDSCALVTIAQGTCFHPSSAQCASASPAASLQGSLAMPLAALAPNSTRCCKSRALLPRTAAAPLLSCDAASCHLLAQ